ncbi:MAG: GNAT family N-acetyltransferase [Ferrimicrobium sp.]
MSLLTITSDRLVMTPLEVDDFRAIDSGVRRPQWALDYPTEGDRSLARIGLHAPCASAPWCHYQVILRSSTIVIGGMGFHGPPINGQVEIGYGIVPSHQHRGYATEAAQALLSFIRGRLDVTTVIATTDPSNLPSQRVLEKLGFTESAATDTLRRFALAVPESPQ